MPIKAKKILIFVSVIMVILTFTTFTTFAAINEFNFTADKFTAVIDGYDSFLIGQYQNTWWIYYFNDSDVGSLTIKSVSTDYLSITFPQGTPQIVFNDVSSCFTYLSYHSNSI